MTIDEDRAVVGLVLVVVVVRNFRCELNFPKDHYRALSKDKYLGHAEVREFTAPDHLQFRLSSYCDDERRLRFEYG